MARERATISIGQVTVYEARCECGWSYRADTKHRAKWVAEEHEHLRPVYSGKVKRPRPVPLRPGD